MKRLELLDYGRFFAAIIVVLFHYTFNGIANGKIEGITHIPSVIAITKYGYLGVELFFMVSGFVIFHSANNRTAAQFAISRATRLYPSYWFAVIFTALFTFFWGGELMSVYPSQVMINFTLLQNYLGFAHVDGVYWTLVYEIEFYFLVFVLIFLGLQQYLKIFFMLWPIAMLVAVITGHDHLPYLGGLFCYFSAGALFAIVPLNKSLKSYLSLLVAFGLCLSYSTSRTALKSETMGVILSEFIVGMIIVSFFIFFIIQNNYKVQQIKLPCSKTLGALTYPLYLIHAHFGYMFISNFATEDNKFFIYLTALTIVIAVSYFMHRVIEIRFSHLWKALFMHTLYLVVIKIQRLYCDLFTAYNKVIKNEK